jgi:hypothetical protein
MMTMSLMVDIPADKKLVLELPETMPEGEASVTITAAGTNPVREAPVFPPFPALEELKEEARRKTAAREASGIDPWIECRKLLNGRQIFGLDALEYQRKMRDEWV